MAGGLTKQQERDRKRWRLKGIDRQLRKAGVPSRYENMRVSGPGFEVRFGSTLRCSNGEAFGNLVVRCKLPLVEKSDWEHEVACGDTQLGFKEWSEHLLESCADEIETYGFLEATDYGLNRIKSLYGNAEWRARQAETELAWLIVKVERRARQQSKLGPIFLRMPDGQLYDSGSGLPPYRRNPRTGLYPGGMYLGQLACYNEMQNGKPMLRMGGGIGGSDYLEFPVGARVETADGALIAERRA